MFLRIAMITEADYPAVKKVCKNGVIGNTYADFLHLVNETIEHSRFLNIDIVHVPIDPAHFAGWLGPRKASRLDLLHYADLVDRNPPPVHESGRSRNIRQEKGGEQKRHIRH